MPNDPEKVEGFPCDAESSLKFTERSFANPVLKPIDLFRCWNEPTAYGGNFYLFPKVLDVYTAALQQVIFNAAVPFSKERPC